jgi:hypothetical protein
MDRNTSPCRRASSADNLQRFSWEGLSGEHADDWRFTQGVTHEFPWARWTSPLFGAEEAWTFRFVLNCLVHPNPQNIPFDQWLNRDLLDTERQFRASARETFAGHDALRSAPVPGWENLDTLIFVEGTGRVYQMRIAGLEAEKHNTDKSLTALLASLRIDSAGGST